MLNFKQVLLGENKNLNLREQSQWPELGSSNNGSLSSTRNFETNEELRITEQITINQNDTIISEPTSSKAISTNNDFPSLGDSFEQKSVKRTRICPFQSNCKHVYEVNLDVNKSKTSLNKCKKIKKAPSNAPISVDINVMLKIALSLAERKHQQKHALQSKKRLLPIQEQIQSKGIACGNKLDSDCPIRHKGKKRPHKHRKCTTIKRSFKKAAEKTVNKSNYFTKRMVRLRQLILSGMSRNQDIDNLVTNLGRLDLQDGLNVEPGEQCSVPMNNQDAVKSVIHTKNFRPYCDHILKGSLKIKSRDLIITLRTFQDKAHNKDPLTSKAKRRYVCGCHEARKFLRADSVKLLLIANNIAVDNGIPTILEEVINMARERGVPVVYSVTATDLGFWTLKKRRTSVLSILNYEGAEKLFNELVMELHTAKKDYQLLIQKIDFHLHQSTKVGACSLWREDELLQEVEQQIRESIISKLTL